MDIRIQVHIVKRILSIADRRKVTEIDGSIVSHKTRFTDKPQTAPLPSATPEECGVDSVHIREFLSELVSDKEICAHSIMVVQSGKTVLKTSLYPYTDAVWHSMFSMSKSVTALAIGMLIDDGKVSLDDKITKLFEREVSPIALLKFRNVTLRHLLTMSSGASFNEAGSAVSESWLKGFFESGISFEAGREFSYNSMNSFILSAIVKAVSGEGLSEFLEKRLFSPLGINNYCWDKCPDGIEKGGWGLYITVEDMAKIGQLLLNGGEWNGKRIISENFIREAGREQIKVSEKVGRFNYGYHFWTSDEPKVVLMNGMFGQNVFVLPDSGTVIAITAGNNDIFQKNNIFGLVRKYFGLDYHPSALPKKKNNREYKRLLKLINKVSSPARLSYFDNKKTMKNNSAECEKLSGRTYGMNYSETNGIGLLPLFAQITQNTYSDGIKKIAFDYKNGVFSAVFNEGDEDITVPIGLAGAAYSDIEIKGDSYRIAAAGRFTTNEDDEPVLVIKLNFLEIPNERLVKVFYNEDSIMTKWSENPGIVFTEKMMTTVAQTIKPPKFLDALTSKMDTDFLTYKVKTTVEPTLRGELIRH